MNKVEKTSRKNAKYVYRFLCAIILMAVATYFFYRNWFNFISDQFGDEALHDVGNHSLLGLGNQGMAVGIYAFLYIAFGRWLRAFKIGVERKSGIIAGQVLTLFSCAFAEMFLSCALSGQFRYFFYFVKLYLIMFCIQSVVIILISNLMVDLYRTFFPPLRVLEIYGEQNDELCYKINGLKYKYRVEESVSIDEDEKVIREKLKQYDAALINDVPAHERNRMVKLCFDMNKRVYYVPKISDVLVKNAQELNLIDAPLFLNKNNGIDPIHRFVKRAFDLTLSLVAFIILSPLMLITALAIHLEDGGPVFFKQERVTIGGKRFMIIKFRSMIVDAEKDGKPHPAGENDDRITKVGKLIRATRIDELPQLINIIAGDMSIVGPRPERWEHVEQYSKEIPEFAFRLKVKGGLTGYAQVYGKYNTTALDKLKLDLLYIANYSFLLDMQIIFQTIKVLVDPGSTEGFTESASQKIHDTEVKKSPELLKS